MAPACARAGLELGLAPPKWARKSLFDAHPDGHSSAAKLFALALGPRLPRRRRASTLVWHL